MGWLLVVKISGGSRNMGKILQRELLQILWLSIFLADPGVNSREILERFCEVCPLIMVLKHMFQDHYTKLGV